MKNIRFSPCDLKLNIKNVFLNTSSSLLYFPPIPFFITNSNI